MKKVYLSPATKQQHSIHEFSIHSGPPTVRRLSPTPTPVLISNTICLKPGGRSKMGLEGPLS
jgi:hypothetical protein